MGTESATGRVFMGCRTFFGDWVRLVRRSSLRFVAGTGIALLPVLMIVGCGEPTRVAMLATERAVDPQMLADLFGAVRTGAFNPQIEALLSEKRGFAKSDANWPTISYLLGESHLRRGEVEQARSHFRELASWAAANHPAGPYGDTWGGSGLATVALWRWLQLLENYDAKSPEEVEQILKIASDLQETRLFSGMVHSGSVPALPLLEEDVARMLAHVAWKHKRPEATALFLNFLTIDSSGTLDKMDLEIQRALLERKQVSPRRLELFRARRLLELVTSDARKNEAAATLKRLLVDPDAEPDVRAEAGHEWAKYRRAQPNRDEVVRVLTDVLAVSGEGAIAEQALYLRGTVRNRGDQVADFEAFRADMEELIRRFPGSRLVDDALFQVATEYFFRGDVDSAITHYERLRGVKAANDYLDSGYFLAALAHIGRASEPDFSAADRLLEEYVQRFPEGVFRARCLFWRGRIAEKRGGTGQARVFFRQVIDEVPYDYYAVRARMHLENGAAVISKDLPASDSTTRGELQQAYRASRVDTQVSAVSPYHNRLRAAVASGLYRELIAIDRTAEARLDAIALDRLDKQGLVPGAALLLSIRQDAMAARDAELTADNRLRLAGMIGAEVNDWATSIQILSVYGRAPRARDTALQRDRRYLATMYPTPASLEFLEPLARAAWPIDGSYGLSQSYMYAIIRQESHFYPRAISQVGAVGLFQFMPSVFDRLNRRWRLLEQSNFRTSAEYLLDAERNIQLWARWVNDEYPLKTRSGAAITLMKHHAGSGNVANWTRYWRRLGVEADVEYQIETARFNATRNFVRQALRDTAMVDAAGLFAEPSGR